MIVFEVFGVPIPKGSMRTFVPKHSKTGKSVTIHDNKRTKPWAQEITATAYPLRRVPLWTGPVSLTVRFQMPKPKSLPTRRHSFQIKKPDADKLLRNLNDALKGIFYRDDAQVVEVSIKKYYADVPSMIVQLQELGVDHAHEFTERHLMRGGDFYGAHKEGEESQGQGCERETGSPSRASDGEITHPGNVVFEDMAAGLSGPAAMSSHQGVDTL